MNDDELDELLSTGLYASSESTNAAVANLVNASEVAAARNAFALPTLNRRGAILSAAAVGVIVLTGGASVTAAQMGIPPFQSIEVGTQRVATAVPVTYIETGGASVTCQAFMEFRNLDYSAQKLVEADIKTHDWTGIGQSAYDTARATARNVDDVSVRFSELIEASLYSEARAVLPQLVHGPSATQGVIFNGYGMSCTPQNNW